MFFKISMQNVKKSYKDYTLYFLTLTFGVCIFYVFNSIEAQKSMMKISTATEEIMKTITSLIGVVSIFISIILGFLIVYANNFLIRKRKKEIGIYMTLGMGKRKVSTILAIETFLIGILSLGIGLLIGIFLSQGLSIITAKLFEADMTEYHFIFSIDGFIKTVIYFSIIFFIVIIMSTVSISRFKLIDLINAEKQNEKPKVRNQLFTIILFILSVLCISIAYISVIKNGIMKFDNRLLFEIILGSIGTFLFFASLSGFFLKFVQSNKKIYYKGLNTFILRQINSRINTAYISISFICLMLFFTIGILSTGLGLNSVLNRSYESSAPFDVSFQAEGDMDIYNLLKKYEIDIYSYTDNYIQAFLYKYNNEELNKSIIIDRVKENIKKENMEYLINSPLYFIKLSDFNALMKYQDKKTINLSKNELAIYSDYANEVPELKKAILEFIDMNYKIDISSKQYSVLNKPLTDGIITSPASQIMLALIVPDEIINECTKINTMLSFDLKGNKKENEEKLIKDIEASQKKYANDEQIKIRAFTENIVKIIAAGTKAIVYFLGIYIGLIFLITSSAVLALQQLSEAADNKHRYNILQKIGADEKLLKSALFKQILIYFILPLLLACIHSVVGIKVANDVISGIGRVNALKNIIVTAILILFVYGSYFIATYFSSKNIILKTFNS